MRGLYRKPSCASPAGMARDSDVRALAFDVSGTTVDWCGGIARGTGGVWRKFILAALSNANIALAVEMAKRTAQPGRAAPACQSSAQRTMRPVGSLWRDPEPHSRLLARAMNPIVTSPIGTITAYARSKGAWIPSSAYSGYQATAARIPIA